ncbi:MAG TPA: succinate-semialdehyde dehydrogenase [Candidatus Omnitrophica bacterium]|nr:MAG: succinate-semialdehyde dehydrogenase [Omnitrophica WOR_2 bacterium GWA2_45_18]HBR15787.1 succinate-semialdehyde dehydrogenase [Candidatus Omnitrophota bacterium]
MSLQSINPATGELIQSYPQMPPGKVSVILESVQKSFEQWREVGFDARGEKMRKAADILRGKKETWARLMTKEMGKPITQARAEIEKCAWGCEFYAEHAEGFLQPETVATDARKSYVSFQPLGVVLAVMPWNFPFWQVFRFLVPALMAGNAAVLKHASNVTGTALAIEEIIREAGFPEHLFRVLLMSSEKVAAVIEHPSIKAVTFTGSTPAGMAVAAKAGGALKKTVLELGGSDPYLILEDADLEKAVTACVSARLVNSGQSCVAAKRFIVVASVKERFERLFVEKMRIQKTGDPLEEDTVVGPQARHDLRDQLHAQVGESLKKGARLLLGGQIPAGKGAFYPPTVLTDVQKGMPAYEEELFGPVAAIIRARDEHDAIEKANDTVFGLGAAVFTEDLKRGEEIAEKRLEAGCCFVNSFVKSDPRLPFGGIKDSGYGRELSIFGIREFVNIKTVYVGC